MGIPETIALIGVVVAAAGAAASTTIQVNAAEEQADRAKAAGKFNEAVNANNALAANQAAQFEARQIRRRNMLRLGAQRAIGAKSGYDITAGGSIDDVIMDSSIQGELEAQSAEYAGKVRSSQYKARGALSVFEGRQAAAAASTQGTAALAGGLTSGLADTTKAYGNYLAIK